MACLRPDPLAGRGQAPPLIESVPMHLLTRKIQRAVTALPLAVACAVGIGHAHAQTPQSPTSPCPHLFVLGVQGIDESGAEPDSVPTDSGALGQVLGHLTREANRILSTYIRVGYDQYGTRLPYEEAIQAATFELEDTAADIVASCPGTKIAAVGYAHGAPAVATFAQHVGAGAAAVRADSVAAIALLANPQRAQGSSELPGTPPGTVRPEPAPGTSGTNVARIEFTDRSLAGAGIAPTARAADYGTLTGRVVDLCVAGDATCDAPQGGPLARAVANIAAASDFRDPIAAITTIADALATTVFTTTVNVVNEDLTGTSLDQLSLDPRKTLGQRLAEASHPDAVPPGPEAALSALFKLGTIGLSAIVTVAREVFTPATVAELATVGLSNPWAAVASLGVKVADAVIDLVPPQTTSRWINQTFDAITSTITDPGELYTVAGAARYSDITGRHGAYQHVAATPDGRSALATTTDWLNAIADDIAMKEPTSARTATPVAPTATTKPAAASAPPTIGSP